MSSFQAVVQLTRMFSLTLDLHEQSKAEQSCKSSPSATSDVENTTTLICPSEPVFAKKAARVFLTKAWAHF